MDYSFTVSELKEITGKPTTNEHKDVFLAHSALKFRLMRHIALSLWPIQICMWWFMKIPSAILSTDGIKGGDIYRYLRCQSW